MERLDLRQVEYFVAVAEELHFGRAAERLYIAQPSLSQQIRRLEAQVGVPLLDRTTRTVALTAAGDVFLREGRRALAQASRALDAARAYPSERLVVGFTGVAGNDLLAKILENLSHRRPPIEVTLRELELSAVEDILSGRVDVAFTRLTPGETELEVEVLQREPRVVAVTAGHPLAARGSILLAELHAESFITSPHENNPAWREQWLAEQHSHGLPGRVAVEASSVQQLLTLVAAGRGVAIVPASTKRLLPRSGVAYLDVEDAAPAVTSLAWRPGNETPACHAFLKDAREAASATT